MSDMESFKQTKQAIAELRKKLKSEVKDLFAATTQQLFADNPTLTSFGWQQYTPYFNDGASCTFSVNTDEPSINGINGYDLEDDLVPLQDKVREFLSQFEEEDFEHMFGDHVEITVSRTGIEVEDYQHD